MFFALGRYRGSGSLLLRHRFSNLSINPDNRGLMGNLERFLLLLKDGPAIHQFATDLLAGFKLLQQSLDDGFVLFEALQFLSPVHQAVVVIAEHHALFQCRLVCRYICQHE